VFAVQPRPKNTRETFRTWCRLTCVLGSANGECPCTLPAECVMREHPWFQEASRQAGQYEQEAARLVLDVELLGQGCPLLRPDGKRR
jgi:hypothetical protein